MHRGYNILNCRLDASKREIEAITNKTYLVLHPDKDGFNQWLMKQHIMVDQATYEEGKAKVVDFFQVWTSIRDIRCELDQGNYRKAMFTRT